MGRGNIMKEAIFMIDLKGIDLEVFNTKMEESANNRADKVIDDVVKKIDREFNAGQAQKENSR